MLFFLQIFDTRVYSLMDQLNNWGVQKLEALIEQCGTTKDEALPVIGSALIRQEFLLFKRVVYRNCMDKNDELQRPNDLFTKIFSEAHKQELFPAMFKLLGLSLAVMIGYVEAEWAATGFA